MRLKTSKSTNATLYYIIKDYTNINGKRSTKIFEKLGNQDQIKVRFGEIDTINKIKEYINALNNEDKEALLKREFNPNKRISPNIKRQFNAGYLFLEKLYYQLKLNEVCDEIQSKYKFQFDLNEILSYLVYARIIYPSSKLETFKQCQNFIEQPKFKLHDEYRALSYIAENMDFIQEQLFNNSKNVIKRELVLSIMIVRTISLTLILKMTLENMASLKNIDLILSLVWVYLWMVMDYLFLVIFIQETSMNKKP